MKEFVMQIVMNITDILNINNIINVSYYNASNEVK